MLGTSRILWCLILFGSLVAVPSASARAQSVGGGGGATKENLDLPFDALGEEEEEEEAPEVVTFYGTQLEGDGVFYCIDRSGSMQDSGELKGPQHALTCRPGG